MSALRPPPGFTSRAEASFGFQQLRAATSRPSGLPAVRWRDYRLHVQTSATEIVSYGSGDVDASPSNTRRLIVGAVNDPDGLLDDITALASGDCVIWFLTQPQIGLAVLVDPGDTAAPAPEAALTALVATAPAAPGQTFDLGDNDPIDDDPWVGAIRIDPFLVENGAEAWLRFISRSGPSIQMRISSTETGEPSDEGPELSAALRAYEEAFTFRNGDRVIVLPGPAHASNVFSDPTEPYFWTPPAAKGWVDWVTDIDGSVTLTLDDGVAIQPLVIDPGETAAPAPSAALTAVVQDATAVPVDPGETAARAPTAALAAVPTQDPVLIDPGVTAAPAPSAALTPAVGTGIPVAINLGETIAPAPTAMLTTIPAVSFPGIVDPGETIAPAPTASLTAVPTLDPVLVDPGSTSAPDPEAALSAIVHIDPVGIDFGETIARAPQASLAALVRSADPILVRLGTTAAPAPRAELAATARTVVTTWPSSLPQEFLRRGYGQEPADNTHRFPVDEGPPLRRPRSAASGTVYRGIMNMTPDQWAAFEEFYDDDLNGGAAEFELRRPLGGNRIAVRFLRTPQRSPRGANWDVSMRLRTV